MIKIKTFIHRLFEISGYIIVKQHSLQKEENPEYIETYGLKRINYACYRNFMQDWINVDRDIIKSDEYITAKVDLTQRHPFQDNVFIYGFAEDFIVCLGQSDLIIFLYEVYRTFRSGGVLRISTPGLEGVLKKHYPDSKTNTALLAKKEAYEKWGIIQFPSFNDLSEICGHIGFTKVKRVDFGKSEHNDLCNIDTRIDQINFNTYIEITK